MERIEQYNRASRTTLEFAAQLAQHCPPDVAAEAVAAAGLELVRRIHGESGLADWLAAIVATLRGRPN